MHSLLIDSQQKYRELTDEETMVVSGGFVGLSTPQELPGNLNNRELWANGSIDLSSLNEFGSSGSRKGGSFRHETTYTYDDKGFPVSNLDSVKYD
jgi:hypothetical protein